MSENYKVKIAEAIAADKAKYGDTFDAKLPLEFKSENEEDYKRLKDLYETSISASDLSEGVTDPEKLVESVNKAVETAANKCGLNVKANVRDFGVYSIKTEGGCTMDINVQDGNEEYETHVALNLKDYDLNRYQSHKEFLDALDKGESLIRHKKEINELKENGYAISANAKNVLGCEINLDEKYCDVFDNAAKDFSSEDYERLSYIMNHCVDAFSPDMANCYGDIVSHVKNRIEDVNKKLENPFTTSELDAITFEKEYESGSYPALTVYKDGIKFGELVTAVWINQEYCQNGSSNALLPGDRLTDHMFLIGSYNHSPWGYLDSLEETVKKERAMSDDFTKALESIPKNDDRRMQMAKAILADEITSDYEFNRRLKWCVKDVSHIEDKFAKDENYMEAIKDLSIPKKDFWGINYVAAPRNYEEYHLITPDDMADWLKLTTQGMMEKTGRIPSVKTQVEIVDNDVITKYFTKEGEHICDATFGIENLQPDVYQSHKLFMDWMREGVKNRNEVNEVNVQFAKAMENFTMSPDPSISKMFMDGLRKDVEDMVEANAQEQKDDSFAKAVESIPTPADPGMKQ